MAIRNILKGDEPALKKKSRVVTDFNKRLHVLLDDMRETLIEADGAGLAAPQVGVLRRAALIVDTNYEADPPEEMIIELINPEIVSESGTQEGHEGCLSIPGVYGIVCRPEIVKVKAQDRYGENFEIMCEGMTARAACHEVDHLNGVVFTTVAERILTEEELEEMRAERRAEKARQEAQGAGE
ncbi:MAG: peptide deformylase [Oscillospiraceae bacterium]|nr:peptide deformylase [Oscillospiraceae bacterium]